jgi:hypothetical protein
MALTNGPELCFLCQAGNENHVRHINENARAGQWLDGHLPVLFPSIGRRGSEVLNQRNFTKPAIAQGSRGFFAF